MLLKGAYCVGEHFVDPQCVPDFQNKPIAACDFPGGP